MGRGIERRKIFLNDTDRNDFLVGVRELGYSGADVARYLGIST
jgi:hypothetical protein